MQEMYCIVGITEKPVRRMHQTIAKGVRSHPATPPPNGSPTFRRRGRLARSAWVKGWVIGLS
jgi:hypothetical protein